jgi:signal transduction histidine kinase
MMEQDSRIPADYLEARFEKFKAYRDSLASLLRYYEDGSLILPEEFAYEFTKHKEKIRAAGKQITNDVEQMVNKESKYVSRLVAESRIYHFVALVGMLCLCIVTVLYLVFKVDRPLRSIEQAVDKIASGDYEIIPALSTGDEFDSLVTSVNHMIQELGKRSEQIVQSEKMASLGTLTSGVAHELNNPLNNISTTSQILLDELEDGDLEYQQQALIEIENQVERARDIVRALLEFSRETSYSPRPIHFKGLVQKTLNMIKGEVPAKVSIKVDVPDDIKGEIDPRRIQQVLINLILNGIQAIEKGGRLYITAWEKEGNPGFYFKVRDTGRGVSKEDLPKIFEPFFTTKDIGHKDVGEGSGLGLAVSQGIIEQHGGWIKAESEMGEGTAFTVFLPQR